MICRVLTGVLHLVRCWSSAPAFALRRELAVLIAAICLLADGTPAPAQVVPHGPGGQSHSHPLSLKDVQTLNHAQLRDELIRRGVPNHLADQAARELQGRAREPLAGGKQSPGEVSKPGQSPQMGIIEAETNPVLQVTPDSDVTVLDELAMSHRRVQIPGNKDQKLFIFALTNNTDLTNGMGLAKAQLERLNQFVDKPQPFVVYAVTKKHRMVKVMLPERVSGSSMPGTKAFNVAAFGISPDEFPLTLYLTDGHDLGTTPTGRGPMTEKKLFDWLQENTLLKLTVTAQQSAPVHLRNLTVKYYAPHKRFVFHNPSTGEIVPSGSSW